MSFVRDYETKGQPLIRLGGSIGVVNATAENFNLAAEHMAENPELQENWKPESGVFCLVPKELDTPF
ncbi:hypothetical protein [methanotrophic endosymbiont of Bathymodiolus puteoserpentis (Logatchev)]|jgi:hypothetical protein|uniref:hypothetical protein n=1 Tax=methanotrophic endosymbiont of Bathymodiolus puteoserpentis (Logatchev) TaxID=343235 RepID=UPI0013CD703B|nr:hypothetical protein [methanotrophic endosymbiont of Bathymodiolus puteoserpentis (Logatchev)]SHE22863.1 hypothetical protein BPUTEOMOX_505 [methanotrophic endosymbiont of Bathymodiolus puteoserpentis (Logatchev)]